MLEINDVEGRHLCCLLAEQCILLSFFIDPGVFINLRGDSGVVLDQLLEELFPKFLLLLPCYTSSLHIIKHPKLLLLVQFQNVLFHGVESASVLLLDLLWGVLLLLQTEVFNHMLHWVTQLNLHQLPQAMEVFAVDYAAPLRNWELLFQQHFDLWDLETLPEILKLLELQVEGIKIKPEEGVQPVPHDDQVKPGHLL